MPYEYIPYIKRSVIRQKLRGFVNKSGCSMFEFAGLLTANPQGSHLRWNLNTPVFQHQY